MILLKANNELKTVFTRMIKTMGANVVWTGNFVVLNNFLILSGNVRSLIFNFDNRKVITNVIELPDREEDMEPVAENEILTNVLNMTLYAFGKWGVIRGLKVDQDYNQLNELFCAILKDLKVTPGFRDDNFRFYKSGIQMTYEEVVQAAIEEGKRKAEEIREEKENRKEQEERLGLWHKIRWAIEQASFQKGETGSYDEKSSRLGNNFYITGYQCPGCGKKLYMVVYPQGQEFPVETEEGRVYLARSYTCDTCNLFYTPRPGKLLREGDIYAQKFGSDRDAYEDYRELLGSKGARTSNCNFNEYASERGKKKESPSIEEACADMEQMTQEELENLSEKLEDGFFPVMKAQPYRRKIEELLRRRREQKKEKSAKNRSQEKDLSGETARKQKASETESLSEKGSNLRSADSVQSKNAQETNGKAEDLRNGDRKETYGKAEDFQNKATGAVRKGETDREEANGRAGGQTESGKAVENVENFNGAETDSGKAAARDAGEKYEARMKVLERMSLRQLRELKNQIQSDTRLVHTAREDYVNRITQAVYQKEEENIREKARVCKDKPYGVIARTIAEIAQAECPESVKKEVLESLEKLKQKRGQQEAEQLIAGMPLHMNRNQYRIFRDKLAQYKDADISAYQEQLEDRRKMAEQQEIDGMLKRAVRSDRKGLMNMLRILKEEGFSEEHAALARKEIEERIRALDEKVIDKICPDIMGMTFDEAAEAYEKIEGGAFLPELKTNTLEMIDKRLTKLKMDECGLLVEKLKEELSGTIKDMERVHFYEVRKVMRGDWEPEEAELVARALNTYAVERERYEFPIIVCDSSGKKNGKEGFVLTPDHIFYNSTFNSEMIPVRSVTKIEGNTGLLNRGIYVNRGNGIRTKIPGGIPAKELGAFAEILDKFVAYLQEKPESRSISYLAKETHEVKCCYRCGFTYRGGTVCPKCGNQANH